MTDQKKQSKQLDMMDQPSDGLPARRAAMHVLDRVLNHKQTMDEGFSNYRSFGKMEARDRAFAHVLMATVLRRLGQIDEIIEFMLDKPMSRLKPPAILDVLRLGIAQLQAFLALAESGLQLNRDIIFMATADEEAGGFFGAGWLVENRPEIFSGVGYVLNEGGSGRRYGEDIAVMVEVTQKVPLWLRLTALGKPGHGSAPQMQTSVTRLIRGLKRVSETEFPVNVIAPVAQMFEGLAPYQSGANRSAFANLVKAVENPDYLLGLKLNNPAGHALLRNTCSITTLEGSSKINVVPAQAHAELDCRLLPDQDPEAFLVDLNNIINDKQISIERIMGFTPAISRTDTPLYKAIAKVSEQAFSAPVIPTVAGGFTDSHFFRDLGVTSYGYSPFVFAPGEFSGVHGNDERLGIENLKQGVHTLYQLLVEFAVQQ